MGQAKQKEISEKILNQEVSITLKRRQWIILNNILVSLQYKLGDAKHILPIADELFKVSAVDSNIDPNKEEPDEGVITN